MNAQELILKITAEFKGVSRNNGITLREGKVLDEYGTHEERIKARLLDVDVQWSDISGNDLNDYFISLSYFDENSFKYYIPAYMILTLREYMEHQSNKCVNFTIYSLSIKEGSLYQDSLNRISKLTLTQCKLIAEYINFLIKCDDSDIDREEAINILNNYWIKYL